MDESIPLVNERSKGSQQVGVPDREWCSSRNGRFRIVAILDPTKANASRGFLQFTTEPPKRCLYRDPFVTFQIQLPHGGRLARIFVPARDICVPPKSRKRATVIALEYFSILLVRDHFVKGLKITW